jgi:hypothetical protein
MIADELGLWSGHVDLADWLFLIAAVLFLVAAVVPHVRASRVDGVRQRVDWAVSLMPLGLCLAMVAWLVL